MGKKKADTGSVSPRMIKDLLKFIYKLGLRNTPLEHPEVDETHPLKDVYDALAVLRIDIDTLSERHLTQREGQERNIDTLKKLQHAGNMAFWSWDICTKSFTFSDDMFHIFEIDPEKNMRPGFDELKNCICRADQDRLCDEFWDAIKNESSFDLSLMTKKIGGKRKKIYFQGDIEKDQNNIPVRMNGIVMDRTEEYEMRIRMNEMQNQLVHSSKLASIGTLMAGVAHEISNAMTILKGNIFVLLETEQEGTLSKKELYERLKKAEKAGNRLEQLVTSLKNCSMPVVENSEQCDLVKGTADLLSLTSDTFHMDGVKIVQSHKSGECLIQARKGEIQQILMNLLINAKDSFNGKAGGVVIFETGMNGNEVFCKVIDNGCGIEEEHLEKIFDPYFSTKSEENGTGLGLGISRAIVEKLKGRMTVKSRVGEGSEFAIHFPKVNGAHCKEELSGSVLVIDDEEEIRDILRHHLSDFGLHVDDVCNGEKALKLIQKKSYNFIITDLKMPTMDGRELLSKIRAMGTVDAKVMVITGDMDLEGEEFKVFRKKYSVDGYLEKPFSKEQIYAMLTTCM